MRTQVLLIVCLLTVSVLCENSHRVRRFDWISGIGEDITDDQWACLAQINFRQTQAAIKSKNITDDYFAAWNVSYHQNKEWDFIGNTFQNGYSNGFQKFDNLYHFIDYPLEGMQTKVLMIEIPPSRTNRDTEPREFVICHMRNFPNTFSVCDKQGSVYADFNLVEKAKSTKLFDKCKF